MIPNPDRALMAIALKMATSLVPEIGSSYHAANAGMMSMLLLALSQDADRAVANRLADVDALKALFKQALANPQAAAQLPAADRYRAFCDSKCPGWLLSQISAWHDTGMALLIELHAWAEDEDPALDRAIWDFLLDHTERNRFDV